MLVGHSVSPDDADSGVRINDDFRDAKYSTTLS